MIAARVTSIELHSERIQSMGISVRSPSDRPDRPDRISRPRNRRLFIAPAITAEIHFVISAPSTRIHLVILDSSPDPKLISNHFQIQILCCSFVLWPTLTGNCSASKSRFSGLLAVTITVTLTTNLAKLPGDAAPQGANCNCIYRAVDVDAVQSTMATATPQKLKTAKTSNDKGASVHTSI